MAGAFDDLIPAQAAASSSAPALASPLSQTDAEAVRAQRQGLNGAWRDPVAHTFADPVNAAIYRDASTGEVVAVDTGAGSGASNLDSVSGDPKVIGSYLAAHDVNPAWQAPAAPTAPPQPTTPPAAPQADAFADLIPSGPEGAAPALAPPPGSDAAVRASDAYQRLHAADAATEAAMSKSSLHLPVVGSVDDFTRGVMPLPIGDEMAGGVEALKAGVGDLLGGHTDPRAAYLAAKDASQQASDAYRGAHPMSATVAALLGPCRPRVVAAWLRRPAPRLLRPRS